MAVHLDIREVTVQSVNDHGIKAEGAWLNISKFAPERDVLLPSVGERVVVSLDKSGFVRKVEPVAPVAAPIAIQTAPQPATGPMASPAESVVLPSSIIQDDRGVVITRLACINSATAILATGGGATTLDEVLEVAARLEAWATR